ncbi:MAG: cobyrinate a,c-diamide synthase [Alphaproteobacteria bacterium]|nr:cobyrinate a,c-diamide synthase [Alphaproteobacteria bacterium]
MARPCGTTKLAKAILIAAPHSGSGKTLITLGLLRALKNRGLKVVSAKVGPDYIDARFHEAASGAPCINLDYWAMGPEACKARLNAHAAGADLVAIEGVMGLFDGPDGAKGSTADLAEALGLPIVLVIDAAKQAQSVAAVVHGFSTYRSALKIAGVILNRVGSDRHARMLSDSLDSTILGLMRQNDSAVWPSRHLGLVQAQENQYLEAFIESAASGVSRETFVDKLIESAIEFTNHPFKNTNPLPPLAQTIAIASDVAFAFAYPHLLQDWRDQGAELRFFSPLANETPNGEAIFLPGGYPELHAGQLAANKTFLSAMRQHEGLIYGECGGYMVLGNALVDKDGTAHVMAGLLPLTTSFATRKLHLGYRQLKPLNAPWKSPLRGHEFHFSTIQSQSGGEPLFHATDAAGTDIGPIGQRVGQVMGSYAHIISQAPA